MNYSVKIKFLRKKNRLTQDKFAEKIGIKRHTVCDWESGRTEPNIIYLQKIANEFKVTVDYIIGLESVSLQNPYSAFNRYSFESIEERKLILDIKDMNSEQQSNFLSFLYSIFKMKGKKENVL